MNINKFIDSIIRENAKKTQDGLYLYVDEMDKNEQENVVDWLFANDPVTREMLQDRMQELIEERISFVVSADNYDAGLRPIHNSENGEVTWIRRYI